MSSLRILLVSVNILLAFFIFQNGFLLKRQEISAKSSCSDAHAHPGQQCWMDAQYRRIILILVDALRYDFLQPTSENEKVPQKEWYYRGQMKRVGELIKSGKASIGTMLADPPTTTLQRLKALTTGTLPTFIDAGDNFSPNASVNEDSFLYQASRLGLNVTLLGDDTWLSLYPDAFSKSAAYDSFDINDLNSVDDKIAPKLEAEIRDSNSSIIIAHFLGVDHCGHKFGPSHPVMADTLRKMDRIIAKSVDYMNSDDLLIVIGDHGMTSTGDHGGDSENEIRAGILVHSKKQQIRLPNEPVHQIDIVPTISLLVGLPIPFSNLGTVILEMFPVDLWEMAVGMNYEQVKRFAETYATQKNFAELHIHTIRDANSMDEQISTMTQIQTVLRIAWTQFDDSYINAGVFSLVEAVLFLMTNEILSVEWIVYRTGCGLLQAALLSDTSDSNGSTMTLLLMSLVVSCLSSLASLAFRALQTRYTWQFWISSNFLGPIFVLLHSICLFSNSFVVYEADLVRFLFQSLVFLVFLENLRYSPPKTRKLATLWRYLNHNSNVCNFAAIMALLRVDTVFRKCREEQIGCKTYWPAAQAVSLSVDAQAVRLLFALATLLSANFLVFRTFATKNRQSGKLRVLSAISWPLTVLVVFHSILVSFFNDVNRANLTAQIVFLASVCCGLTAGTEKNWPIVGHFALFPIYLLFGDGILPALVIFVGLSIILKNFVGNEILPSVVCLLIPHGFYHLNHSPVISSIPWTAAFVGIPGTWALRLIPAFFVLLHLNFSAISSILMCSDRETLKKSIIMSTIRATFACVAASIHRRHLMVWKIFAPKFIFECVACLIFVVSANCLSAFWTVFRAEKNLKKAE